MSSAVKCPCGSRYCSNWLIQPEAYIQGVSFTERQARAVAETLNRLAAEVQDDKDD